MKKLFVFTVILLISGTAFSQVVFDLGLKAGVHTSKLNFEVIGDITDDLSSDAITKTHWGAFGRVGYNRLYVQPEIYFGKKGGTLTGDLSEVTGDFNYKNIDAPLLLGYQIIKGKLIDFRVLAGPVFSFITDSDLNSQMNEEYLEDNVIGLQYGLGADVLFLTIDARIEHGGNVYKDPNLVTGKATTYMLTVGFKIL